MKRFMLVVLFTIVFSSGSMADDTKTYALNIRPLAIPVYNLYAVNFEFAVAPRHGLNIRLDYAPISDNGIDVTDYAMNLNYRWYFSKSMDSIFADAYSRFVSTQDPALHPVQISTMIQLS